MNQTDRKPINEYSTHLPVLQKLFSHKKYPRILEFGMGFGSTPYLLDHCESLTSIEMQSEDWYKSVSDKFRDNPKWKGCFALGPFAFESLDVFGAKYDLVFVDGHGESRPEVINLFFGRCDLIVAHDFETCSYRWHLINQPADYHRAVYTELNPHTAVFTKDPAVAELFK